MFMKQNLTNFFPIEHFDYFNAISRYLSISRSRMKWINISITWKKKATTFLFVKCIDLVKAVWPEMF